MDFRIIWHRCSPLRVKVPSETFVHVRLLTPSHSPPPPKKSRFGFTYHNPALVLLTYSLTPPPLSPQPALPQRPPSPFFFSDLDSHPTKSLTRPPLQPPPLHPPPPPPKKKNKKKKKKNRFGFFVKLSKKKITYPLPQTPSRPPPLPQFFSSDLDSLSICKKKLLRLFPCISDLIL